MRVVQVLSAVILAATGANAFVAPVLGGNAAVKRMSKMTAPFPASAPCSWRWSTWQRMDAGGEDSGAAGDKANNPFSSLRDSLNKAASRFARSPFSRPATADEGGGATDDLLNSEAFLKKKIQMLEKQIHVTEDEIEQAEADAEQAWQEWGPQVENLEKEFSVLKSRGSEAIKKSSDRGTAQAVNNILQVVDNFDRAAAAINPETDGERAVVEYYQGVYDKLMGTLDSLGVQEVETIGAQFDYNVHNAIMRESTNEYPEDVICNVYQKGYKIGDELIRPAMVAVAVSG